MLKHAQALGLDEKQQARLRTLGTQYDAARDRLAAAVHFLADVPPPLNGSAGRIAYKTGTSYGYRDAWAIGFDGKTVIGVWVGRPDNSQIPGITGIRAAAPILFEAFDRPDTNQSCPRRNETTIAPQALELLNSEFSLHCAMDLAAILEQECGDDRALRIDRCYLRTLGRSPTPKERERASAFDREAPLADLCLAMFNLNEFVYVD